MSLNVELLRSSFELVLAREPDLTGRFYEILFERYPSVRPLFRNAGDRQPQMLKEALAAVVDHLEDTPWLVDTLKGLGAKHTLYGVTDEMYDWVGDCLLRTLEEVAGPSWNADLQSAWAAAYEAIAGLMKSGAAAEHHAA